MAVAVTVTSLVLTECTVVAYFDLLLVLFGQVDGSADATHHDSRLALQVEELLVSGNEGFLQN